MTGQQFSVDMVCLHHLLREPTGSTKEAVGMTAANSKERPGLEKSELAQSLKPLGWRRPQILGPSEVRGTEKKRSTQEWKLKRKNQLGRKKTKILGTRGRESSQGQKPLPEETPGGNGPG